MNHDYVECDCYSAEHTLRFTLDEDNIIVDVQLNKCCSIFGRIWRAIKYIFGYDCQYGHWDEALISGEQVKKLRDLCDKHLLKQLEKNYKPTYVINI